MNGGPTFAAKYWTSLDLSSPYDLPLEVNCLKQAITLIDLGGFARTTPWGL
jgi:hypothetical protein